MKLRDLPLSGQLEEEELLRLVAEMRRDSEKDSQTPAPSSPTSPEPEASKNGPRQ